jgi:PhnB protein
MMSKLSARATEFHPLADTAWGRRAGQFIDPFGHRWGLYRHDRDVPSEEVGRPVSKLFGADT